MSRHFGSWAFAAALCAGSAFAQERPINPFQGGEEDPRQKMMELFKKVETRLGEIDKMLYDAGTGETRLASNADSGLSELLKSSRKKQEEVLSGIDEILEIASQQGGGSCKSAMKQGGGQPKSAQGEPKQGSPEQQAKESTPERPGEPRDQQGQKPEQPSAAKNEPKGDQESKSEPENSAGGPPPKLATSVAEVEKANAQWGDLPPTVRDLFTTEGGGDLPPQYRDWIDAYYRRLNRERR